MNDDGTISLVWEKRSELIDRSAGACGMGTSWLSAQGFSFSTAGGDTLREPFWLLR